MLDAFALFQQEPKSRNVLLLKYGRQRISAFDAVDGSSTGT
jgi:hypothetical protein